MACHTQAFHVGECVRVFCCAADAWLDGWVVDPETPGLVTVQFRIDGQLHRKTMLAASDSLQASSRLGSGVHGNGSPAVCDIHTVDEVDPDSISAEEEFIMMTSGNSHSKHSLGCAVNLAAEHAFKNYLMTGEVQQVDRTLEIMTSEVIDTQSSILKLIGIGDDSGTEPTYPWHLGHLVGVTGLGNYTRYARTEKTQHVVLCLCRSTFCTQFQKHSLALSDAAELFSKDCDKDTWHCFHGMHYVSKVMFGGLIHLNVKVKVVQEVNDSQAVLGTVSRIIADAFSNTVKNKDLSPTYLRSALSDYEEQVTITVSARSAGVTPEGFGMEFSLANLVDQVKEFRTKVDELPHDPSKCTVVGIGVKSAQDTLRKYLPGVALSKQDEVIVNGLLKRACMAMHDTNFFLASLGRCQEEVGSVCPREANREMNNQIKKFRELDHRLISYIHSGVVDMLEDSFPEGVELNEEQKEELAGLIGKGTMTATEFVGRAHPDNLRYEGYIYKGEAIIRGTVKEQDSSVWASGGAGYLQRLVNDSIERHISYPAFMDVYKLASKKSQTMGACTGRRTSGVNNGIEAGKR